MNNTGYRLTDWIFFFNVRNRRDIADLMNEDDEENDIPGEFITYKLITVFLPVVPYMIVLLLNILLNAECSSTWFTFVNNGSLPIISFGIISAGMPYLLEQLEEYPNFHIIRRRVMAVAMIFLFLTAAMYIFQTISGLRLGALTNWTSFILSAYIFFFCASIGYKMFILQSKNIKSFAGNIRDGVEQRQNDVQDL
jgi:hypothetical protein